MNKTLVFVFYLLGTGVLLAQNGDSPCITSDCRCILKKADKQADGQQFEKALNLYFAAFACDGTLTGEAEQRIQVLFTKLDKMRKTSIENEREARRVAEEATIQKNRAEAVLDRIYFYNDRFGQAYDKKTGKYGFIDKDLHTRIEFLYDEVQPFDEAGYAKVRKDTAIVTFDAASYEEKTIRIEYYKLIDTFGIEYPLATNIAQLDSRVTALDLRNQSLQEIPGEVFNQTQLRILLLSSNQLNNLPAEISTLSNLQTLDLRGNRMFALPAEIERLKNLKRILLPGQVHPADTQTLRSRMPWCKVIVD